MKVFVQVVDTNSGISQYGMIEELVKKGFEVANALGHFGVNINSVEWNSDFVHGDIKNTPRLMTGRVSGTSKVVSIVAYEDSKNSSENNIIEAAKIKNE